MSRTTSENNMDVVQWDKAVACFIFMVLWSSMCRKEGVRVQWDMSHKNCIYMKNVNCILLDCLSPYTRILSLVVHFLYHHIYLIYALTCWIFFGLLFISIIKLQLTSKWNCQFRVIRANSFLVGEWHCECLILFKCTYWITHQKIWI